MVTQFGKLKSHHFYVLRLYRHSIRTINQTTDSLSYQKHIKERIKTKINDNKFNKSSWSVHNLLVNLETVNSSLVANDFTKVNEILDESNKTNEDTRIIGNLLKEKDKVGSNIIQDPKQLKELSILDKYIKVRQSQDLLPICISKKLKRELLLPIALDWNAKNKIRRIQSQLDKGVPNIYLSYTKAGPSTIWFVRSPVNKSKSQSKKLSKLISAVKKENQMVLDGVESCEKNAKWAFYEALWEEYLSSGKLLKYSSGQALNKMTQLRQSDSVEESKKISSSKQLLPDSVISWLLPISETISQLTNTIISRAKYFDHYKDEVLIKGGHIDYYTKKTTEMYNKRKMRFDAMLKNEVPSALTFEKDRNLTSILEDNKF